MITVAIGTRDGWNSQYHYSEYKYTALLVLIASPAKGSQNNTTNFTLVFFIRTKYDQP